MKRKDDGFYDALYEMFNIPYVHVPAELPPMPILHESQEVVHSKFGRGFVISLEGDYCNILFEGFTKKLVTKYCKFELPN